MDFNSAASRLQKDHDNLRQRALKYKTQGRLASQKSTNEAKKKLEYRKLQLEKKKRLQKLERKKQDYIKTKFDSTERRFGVVRHLGGGTSGTGTTSTSSGAGTGNTLLLEATSIHGQGDKITLPASLLSTLANRELLSASQERGQPLFFRLGITNPNYSFPASEKMVQFMNEYHSEQLQKLEKGSTSRKGEYYHDNDSDSDSVEKDNDDDDDEIMDIDEEEDKEKSWEQAYLDELSYEYISYVYATIIEFSQEEGYIGLPKSIASSLLHSSSISFNHKNNSNINDNNDNNNKVQQQQDLKSKLTVDPSLASATKHDNNQSIQMEMDDKEMATNTTAAAAVDEEDLESKTPGHPAYGLFPIPTDSIQITLLSHLPLGTKCTLQPTSTAIQNGFYNLKDVKVVLEQSLIRTRGCLNIGDVVHCWYRGKKFDLDVNLVTPNILGAVSCVNTDVEVDIATAAAAATESNGGASKQHSENETGRDIPVGRTLSGGYQLQSNTSTSTSTNKENAAATATTTNSVTSATNSSSSSWSSQMIQELKMKDIPSEAPMDQKENIITIQFRGGSGISNNSSSSSCRGRFDSHGTTMEHLFCYIIKEVGIDYDFCFVTRFPRKVYTWNEDGMKVLKELNLSNQELFLIEKV
jgi:hypothetical protein